MNSGKVLSNVIKHIDPREPVKRQPVGDEIIELSAMMRTSGTTPYRFIRRGISCLARGDFIQACDWLDYAEGFTGVFWPARSDDNAAFKTAIDLLRLQFLFLGEKFKELRPDD